ncbi:DUF2175 domain-containing protein [Pyrobaculum neutrophilum]|uniref:DUF2175 domain-containing protein n=1 Tax=Pyrobaculum neutrophilum (strain DSM 2338 / JCM 9278 / NBRC 100436 / V24Sta) TaxID=444157 RepID=B1YD87_PYRNV|nr:DUF2175 domain-containing protein [Pyrobaculum neutrophilum]ACB39750.1 conserved hypothetical protein [Pyrobaculum neutrophilum V24Sta]
MRKRWRCAICGDEIVEGQLFTFYSKGAVHWECWEREISPKVYRDVDLAAILRLDHYLHVGIVLSKELEHLAQGEEARRKITEVRKQLEALAAKLTAEVASKTS